VMEQVAGRLVLHRVGADEALRHGNAEVLRDSIGIETLRRPWNTASRTASV
jgi:hypothetical protein